jgi:hypothetical protein
MTASHASQHRPAVARCDLNPIGETATLDREKEEAMPVKAGVVGAGKRPTRRGPAETFTGVVFQELLIPLC